MSTSRFCTLACVVIGIMTASGAYGVMLEDFSSPPVDGGDPSPGGYRQWYQVCPFNVTFGRVGAASLNGSPAMRIIDSGYFNGAYAIYPAAVTADGWYKVKSDVYISEHEYPDTLRQFQMGVVVNGVHRITGTLDGLMAVDVSKPGQAVGNYSGLTPDWDSSVQVVTTGSFFAAAGSDLLVVFSSNVETARRDVPDELWTDYPGYYVPSPGAGTFNTNSRGYHTAGAWSSGRGGTDIIIDNIELELVPEPATLTLLAFGGLVLRRARRQ